MVIENIIRSPDTLRKNRVPPGQHLTDKWPVLHYGSVPAIQPLDWRLKVFGLVKEDKTITHRDFMALPAVRVLADIHCVTTWSRLDNLWEGVSTETLNELVEISPAAKYVIVHGTGDFSTNLALTDFFQPDVLLAVAHDHKPLSADHGAPVRLVVPRLYFWKSAKWLTGLEFTEKDRPGFWESHGYHNHGDPWKEERYSG